MILSNKTLLHLAQHIVIPTYDRTKIKARIVHLGFGAFHRAHQAVYTDQLAAEFAADWGYCEISLAGGQQKIADLNAQDHLFSVSTLDAANQSTRIIGTVVQALHAESDGITNVLAAMAAPEVAIVSITVTEKGYCYQPANGKLNREIELVQHDIAHPQQPRSVPGVIVAALQLRKQRGLKPFSVMSCDNLPENGRLIRNLVLELAELNNPELAKWIGECVSFPSTMVDRIVPAVTAQTLAQINNLLGGIDDRLGVVCEPFRQWVIEDNFVNGRPEWQKVGVELVDDVLPYEEMKLRMLNGSHSFLAYLGYLAGYQHIDDCMQDANYVAAAHHLMLNEQAPTLRTRGIDLAAYTDALLQRYCNSALKHRTWQIAMDGTLKLPQRMLDSVRIHLSKGSDFSCLALGIAGWMRYVNGIDEQGQKIEISDPLAQQLKLLVKESAEGEERVRALLSLQSVFANDLPKNQRFVTALTQAYQQLLTFGARKAVAQLVANF